MRIFIPIAIASALVMTGCTLTGNFRDQFASSCKRADSAVRAIQVLQDAGELSASNSRKFNKAKVTVATVCNGPVPTNADDALVTAAQVYVVLSAIWKDEK